MSASNSTTAIRIRKEIKMVRRTNSAILTIEPCVDDDIYRWSAYITPDESSVYHNRRFELSIHIPATYPYTPPRIVFDTPIFHPNINTSGLICISSLGKDWSPALTIEKSLYSILSLLDEPNPLDPLRPEAAELYLSNKEEYAARCNQGG